MFDNRKMIMMKETPFKQHLNSQLELGLHITTITLLRNKLLYNYLHFLDLK